MAENETNETSKLLEYVEKEENVEEKIGEEPEFGEELKKEIPCFSCKCCLKCSWIFVLVVLALTIFIFVSITFGYNGIKPVMLKEKTLFHEFCNEQNTKKSDGVESCPGQIVWLDATVQISQGFSNFFAYFLGTIQGWFDYELHFLLYVFYDTGVLGFLALVGVWISCRGTDSVWWLIYIFYGFSIVSGGGMMYVFFGKFANPAIFPKEISDFWKRILGALMIALFTFSWDLAGLVFYLFQILILDANFDTLILFCSYCFVCLVLSLPFFCIWEPDIMRNIPCKFVFSIYRIMKIKKNQTIVDNPSVNKKSEKSSFSCCKCTACQNGIISCLFMGCTCKFLSTFVRIIIWKISCMLQTSFLFSVVYNQAYFLSGNNNEMAKYYTNIFNILFPSLSFVTVPIFAFTTAIGYCIERKMNQNTGTSSGLILGQVFFFIGLSVFSICPFFGRGYIGLQIPFYCFLIIGRIYGFMLNYQINIELDAPNFARNSGMALTIAGILVTSCPGLNAIVQNYCDGNYMYMNIGIACFSLIGHISLLSIFVQRLAPSCIRNIDK